MIQHTKRATYSNDRVAAAVAAPRGRGFTLIEILVVVVILGIVSAMIVPSLGNRDDLNVAAAARVLVADLTYAQNRAITTQKYVYVRFNRNGTTNADWTLYDSNTDGSINTSGALTHPVNGGTYQQVIGVGNKQGLERLHMSGLDIDSSGTTNQETIGFDPLGTPWSLPSSGGKQQLVDTAVVTIRATSGYSMTVNVTPYTGEISVTTP
jgi:prepilin-type N-terminal cleavage/methylation domain-containing protein